MGVKLVSLLKGRKKTGNRVLKIIFRPKAEEVKESWRKFH
jgi:hypothetical protein